MKTSFTTPKSVGDRREVAHLGLPKVIEFLPSAAYSFTGSVRTGILERDHLIVEVIASGRPPKRSIKRRGAGKHWGVKRVFSDEVMITVRERHRIREMRIFIINRGEVKLCWLGRRTVWVRETSGHRLMMKKDSLSAAEGSVALVLGPQTKVHILIAHCQSFIESAQCFENIPSSQHAGCGHRTECPGDKVWHRGILRSALLIGITIKLALLIMLGQGDIQHYSCVLNQAVIV